MSLFDEGVRILEERTASTLLRRVSLRCRCAARRRGQPGAARRGRSTPPPPGARLAIVHFPHAVERDRLPPADVGRLDHVAACRTGTTSSSCPAARTRSPISRGCGRPGLADWILEQHRGGATVIGICGGYQMLGRTIRDPDGDGVDRAERPRDLGLLPAATVAQPREADAGGHGDHAAEASGSAATRSISASRRSIGATSSRRLRGSTMAASTASAAPGVIGTYLHGAFEHPEVCAEVFGIEAPSATSEGGSL